MRVRQLWQLQASLRAIYPRVIIGVVAAIACTLHLRRKVNLESGKSKT
jgi:hypothetical protein